jgi:uncharacterized protein (DUF58 family)
MLYGSGVETAIPTRSGRRHVLHMLHRMLDRGPATESGPTRLNELLAAAANLIKRRSTVFVISDFISEPGWEKTLAQLAQRHEVVAVRVLDPLELELPDLGLLTLRDAETGEQVVVDTHDAGFRKRFARIAAQRESELREALTRSSVDALELSTDADLVDAIVRFIEMRKRLSQLSAGSLPAHLKRVA